MAGGGRGEERGSQKDSSWHNGGSIFEMGQYGCRGLHFRFCRLKAERDSRVWEKSGITGVVG